MTHVDSNPLLSSALRKGRAAAHPTALATLQFAQHCLGRLACLNDMSDWQVINVEATIRIRTEQYCLFGSDVASLLPDMWLTGRTMDVLMALATCHHQDVSFVSSIRTECALAKYVDSGIVPPVSYLDRAHRKTFLPVIIRGSHWVLYTLERDIVQSAVELVWYNSLPGYDADTERTARVLHGMFTSYDQQHGLSSSIPCTIRKGRSAMQSNSSDGGPVALANAVARVFSSPAPASVIGIREFHAGQIMGALSRDQAD